MMSGKFRTYLTESEKREKEEHEAAIKRLMVDRLEPHVPLRREWECLDLAVGEDIARYGRYRDWLRGR